jgi:hypothetical protein
MTDPGRFERTIGPANLLGLVRNTAPYLFERPGDFGALPVRPPGRLIDLGAGGAGWLEILLQGERLPPTASATAEQREDYFALCLACHHATVGTFVPTDVDSKIRGLLWAQAGAESARRMLDLVLQAGRWDVGPVTARVVFSDSGPLSGHDGERLSVLAGALGAFVRLGDPDAAERAAAAIDDELRREARELDRAVTAKESEIRAMALAAILTHNVGDLDQGISFWRKTEDLRPYRERFGRLAHENTRPYGGAFQVAAHLYKHTLAPEGHRNYPLREVRALRRSPDLLLPISPFLDAWGERLGSHPGLGDEDRAEVLAALLLGCKKIPGQLGYYRAVAGMSRALGSRLDRVARLMPAALRQELRSPEVRRHVAIQPASFESSMRKKARTVLDSRT